MSLPIMWKCKAIHVVMQYNIQLYFTLDTAQHASNQLLIYIASIPMLLVDKAVHGHHATEGVTGAFCPAWALLCWGPQEDPYIL